MKVIVLDAGHGGKDPGAQGHGLKEKDIALQLTKMTAHFLSSKYDGVDVIMARRTDNFIELVARSKMANNLKADAFISLHINAAAATNADGFETFTYNHTGEKTVALQNDLHNALAPLWKGKSRADRGKKQANFHVLRETNMPAVLIEFGFISNAIDANILRQHRFLTANAEALADALAKHFKLSLSEHTSETIYRVKKDGTQVGAYSKSENTLDLVSDLMKKGTNKIEIELV